MITKNAIKKKQKVWKCLVVFQFQLVRLQNFITITLIALDLEMLFFVWDICRACKQHRQKCRKESNMHKMILVPVEQYNRMIESYDKAMEELQEVREQLKAMKDQDKDVTKELKLYEVMDKQGYDRDVAELLLRDQEE